MMARGGIQPPPRGFSGRGALMMSAMRIDWFPFLVVFLVLTVVVGGTLLGLYALFNRFLAFLEKREK
jgi:hypothetical protein